MNLKSNKAITLVALIITIIILLILAGVSLSMILGENGLINKAQSSVDKYQESSNNEQDFLNNIDEYITKLGSANIDKYEDVTVTAWQKVTPELCISGRYVTINFESSDESVATVNKNTGEVTGVKAGKANITVKIIDYLGKETSKSCTITVVYPTVTISGAEFYIIDNKVNSVTLLSKNIIGSTSWSNAVSKASSYGRSLGGIGRQLTKDEAENLDLSVRAINVEYWTGTNSGGSHAWYVHKAGQITLSSDFSNGHVVGIRPVIEMEKSKLP